MSTNNLHSILVQRQVPQYIREQHPLFVSFLEGYYEWMELNGNAVDLNKNLADYQDIDKTLDSYITYFKKEFLSKIPEKLYVDPLDSTRTVDKRKLLKNIKQFYNARGTEKSFRFLFRILFDTEIDFYYPRVDMLKASDGKWFQDVTIRTRQLSGNPFLFANQKVRGKTSNSTGFVEHVQKISVGPFTVYEIFLNRSSVIGQFLPNEKIISDTVVGTEVETYHLLTGLTITNPGFGYAIGDNITITQNGPGYGASARVSNVDEDGRILKTTIIDYGAGYAADILPTQIVFPNRPTQATAEAIIGGQTLYPGYFLNDDGKLSDAKFIQDSVFYQQFSYVIKVGQSFETYKTILKELLHPAGLRLFGNFLSQNLIDAGSKISVAPKGGTFVYITRHVGYNPYGLYDETPNVPADYTVQNYVVNARCSIANDGNLVTLNPVVDQRTRGEISTYKLGPSWRSIEKFKFTYIPTEGSLDANLMAPPNVNYWDLYGNTQIEYFENIAIEQIEDNFREKINVMPESVVTTTT